MSATDEVNKIMLQMGRVKAAHVRAKKKEEEAKAAVYELEEKLLAAMKKAKLDTAGIKNFTAARGEQEYVRITDYRKFANFVIKEKATQLFQNRISVTAAREIKESGVRIPGIEFGKKEKVTFTVKKK